MGNSKTIRRDIAFLISDCGQFAVIANKNVPDGVKRTALQSADVIPILALNASPETAKAAAETALVLFKKNGFAYKGKNNDYCNSEETHLVVVPVEDFLKARPDLAGYSDDELVSMYQNMQRDQGTRLSPQDLAAAKQIWAQRVALGVSTGTAAHRREKDEREQKAKAFPVQGNYADALPNC